MELVRADCPGCGCTLLCALASAVEIQLRCHCGVQVQLLRPEGKPVSVESEPVDPVELAPWVRAMFMRRDSCVELNEMRERWIQ